MRSRNPLPMHQNRRKLDLLLFVSSKSSPKCASPARNPPLLIRSCGKGAPLAFNDCGDASHRHTFKITRQTTTEKTTTTKTKQNDNITQHNNNNNITTQQHAPSYCSQTYSSTIAPPPSAIPVTDFTDQSVDGWYEYWHCRQCIHGDDAQSIQCKSSTLQTSQPSSSTSSRSSAQQQQ